MYYSIKYRTMHRTMKINLKQRKKEKPNIWKFDGIFKRKFKMGQDKEKSVHNEPKKMLGRKSYT